VLPAGPNQLWVADITYIAIASGFVYLAAILDACRVAWSARPSLSWRTRIRVNAHRSDDAGCMSGVPPIPDEVAAVPRSSLPCKMGSGLLRHPEACALPQSSRQTPLR
jgi:hypothetical protein